MYDKESFASVKYGGIVLSKPESSTSGGDQASAQELSLRVVQVSDVHLLQKDSERLEHFRRIFDLAIAQQPDCIVLTGDLTDLGFDNPADLAWAKKQLKAVGRPILLIPGNHDVGDKTGQGPNSIDAQRLANWVGVFGQDHFIEDIGPWRLIGLNSLLVASGLPQEQAQLQWLDQRLDEARKMGQQVAIFMHEPPFLGAPGQSYHTRSDYWAINTAYQHAYHTRLRRPEVKLVASGHVHWYNAFEEGGVLNVWCPSPVFLVDDEHFPRSGCGRTGLIVYTLGPSGATHQLVTYQRSPIQVVKLSPG